MKWLIGCERYGRVRDAMIERGHDAISCDTEPTEAPGPHIQADVLTVAYDPSFRWDAAVFFPPCTYLTKTGLFWNEGNIVRQTQTRLALVFVKKLMDAPIKRKGLENPPGRIGTAIMPATQTIHPWQFGHEVKKETCLWLFNLPRLTPTEIVGKGEDVVMPNGNRMSKWYADSWNLPKRERAAYRGKTFQGIADAMAEQWG